MEDRKVNFVKQVRIKLICTSLTFNLDNSFTLAIYSMENSSDKSIVQC